MCGFQQVLIFLRCILKIINIRAILWIASVQDEVLPTSLPPTPKSVSGLFFHVDSKKKTVCYIPLNEFYDINYIPPIEI